MYTPRRPHRYNFANVRRWTKKFDIFALEKVVMPVHVGQMHWCLAVMFMQVGGWASGWASRWAHARCAWFGAGSSETWDP